MARSTADVAKRAVASITTCPICLEQFEKPKSLPCLHTYCLKCLQGTYKFDQVGDMVPCPECRQEFEIPAGGLSNLKNDFKVQSLIDLGDLHVTSQQQGSLSETRKLQLPGPQSSSCEKHTISRWSCSALRVRQHLHEMCRAESPGT